MSSLSIDRNPGTRLRDAAGLSHGLARLVSEAPEAWFDADYSRGLVLLARLYYHGFQDAPRARAALSHAVSVLEKNPVANLEALVSGARCLGVLHSEMPRVRDLFDSLGVLGQPVIDTLYFQWGVGLVRRWEGDVTAARRNLARAAHHARARIDHWAEFECTSALAMLELELGEDALARDAAQVLLSIAERLGPAGSESAFARALAALATADAAALAAARAELARMDAQALFAYVTSIAAARVLLDGADDDARSLSKQAVESALRSTQPVEIARAHAVLGRVALMSGLQSEADDAFAVAARLAADLPADVRAMLSAHRGGVAHADHGR